MPKRAIVGNHLGNGQRGGRDLFVPAGFSGFFRYFRPPFFTEFRGSRIATFQAAKPSGSLFDVRLRLGCFARAEIDDILGELVGIARTLRHIRYYNRSRYA